MDSLDKKSMCFMALRDSNLALSISVLATADIGAFVVPPADLFPVRLVVFEELSIVLEVLTNSEHYLISRNSRLFSRDALVPLAFTVMESSDGASNIDDGTLFSLFVFQLDSSEFGILIAWHEVDTTLLKFLEQVTGMEFFFNEVLQLRALVIDKFQVQGSDLELEM